MNPLNFNNIRILICGDIMLDRYWHGKTDRLSPEAPVPVVQINRQEDRLGGAANVARNIVALGGKATLHGTIGQDEQAESVQQLLDQAGIQHQLTPHPTAGTHTKLRIIGQQHILRVDFADNLATTTHSTQHSSYQQALAEHQLVILSDYAKGTLSDPQPYIQAASAAQKPILVDPKGTDFERYRGATLLTPNLAEYTAVVGACPDQATLVNKGQQLIQALDLQALLITQSEQGMTLIQAGQAPYHLNTQARDVYDVTGAGDTVIATLASVLATGAELKTATQLANLAAGCVVAKRGTASLSAAELQAAQQATDTVEPTEPAIDPTSTYQSGILNETQLTEQINAARARGERIVMTNGCFDILHAGHTHCLAEAAKLGDRLLVATNTDASIRSLKGPERPINPQQHRQEVLAAIKGVDWVVAYEELTPERLVQVVKPDVLVKGAEYANEQIPGADIIRATGGEVVYIETANSTLSTSKIIATIRARTES